MPELLNYKEYGNGSTSVFIIHGLFGSLDNWHSFAKELSKAYRVITVDLRNHGRSFHDDEFNYNVLVQDLHLLWSELSDRPAVWIGHSLGGKTVINLTNQYPEMVSKLVVLDMGVKEYPRSHDQYFDAMFSLPIRSINSRKEADNLLEAQISDWAIRQFLLKNLDRSEEGYQWKFNLQVIYDNYDSILSELNIEVIEVPALFVRGSRSSYVQDVDIPQILDLFPDSRIETVEEAGHWIHAEKPQALLQLLQNFLP